MKSSPATPAALPAAEFWRVTQLSSFLGGVPVATLYKWVERYPSMPAVLLPSVSNKVTYTRSGRLRKPRANYLFPIAEWKAWFRSHQQGRAVRMNGAKHTNTAGQGGVRTSGDLIDDRHSTTRAIQSAS